MPRLATIVLIGLLVLVAGCGGGDDEDTGAAATETRVGETEPTTRGERERTEAEAEPEADAETETEAEPEAAGTEVVARDSQFGTMLFGSNRQAIYVFENDPEGESACYGDCAEAWPPVHTRGEPRAGRGVRESLLGTTERRDGRLQVTYAGKPLYYYAHERPGEVRCHNVQLNGGFWWVVGPDGERRP